MSDTLSACSTVDGYLSRPVKTAGLVSEPKPPLIMPSATLLHVKPAMGIIFCINLNFSQPCEGKMFTGVSQGTQRGDTKCWRGSRRERTEESGREGDQGENKCNTDKRALLIGLWVHRFRYIIGSKKGVKMSEYRNEKERRARIC